MHEYKVEDYEEYHAVNAILAARLGFLPTVHRWLSIASVSYRVLVAATDQRFLDSDVPVPASGRGQEGGRVQPSPHAEHWCRRACIIPTLLPLPSSMAWGPRILCEQHLPSLFCTINYYSSGESRPPKCQSDKPQGRASNHGGVRCSLNSRRNWQEWHIHS